MTTKTRKFRPSPAIVISCLALFLALTGSAFAVGVGKNTVRSAQIVDSTVRTIDLRDNAVSSPKIADAAVTAADLGTDSVGSDEIAKDAVKSEEIADNAVTTTEVAPDSLTAGDLAANSVTSSEVADESLGANDLAANSVGSSELQAGSVRASELAGIITASNTTTLTAGATGGVTATCPAGTVVISGGGNPSNWNVPVVSMYRSGNGWTYQAKNPTATSETLTVYAYCLSA